MSGQFIFDVTSGLFQTSANWVNEFPAVPPVTPGPPGATGDALIDHGDTATSSINETVFSISTYSNSKLIVSGDSTFTATNGTFDDEFLDPISRHLGQRGFDRRRYGLHSEAWECNR